MAKRMQDFGGETYYLDDIYEFRRDAKEQWEYRKERGYKARIKNVAEGWAVYYK
jgi:hypothetical protein